MVTHHFCFTEEILQRGGYKVILIRSTHERGDILASGRSNTQVSAEDFELFCLLEGILLESFDVNIIREKKLLEI